MRSVAFQYVAVGFKKKCIYQKFQDSKYFNTLNHFGSKGSKDIFKFVVTIFFYKINSVFGCTHEHPRERHPKFRNSDKTCIQNLQICDTKFTYL